MNGPSIFVPERDLGGIELKWFTSCGQEFDRQCLIADDDPFTGAINIEHAESTQLQAQQLQDLLTSTSEPQSSSLNRKKENTASGL